MFMQRQQQLSLFANHDHTWAVPLELFCEKLYIVYIAVFNNIIYVIQSIRQAFF